MSESCWLILPTYNEAENLEAVVRLAGSALDSVGGCSYRVLIVDDNSPDGSGQIADRLVADLEWVEVLHRQSKGGLGRAYLAGFERALAGGADYIFEMDADFSHDPEDLKRLLSEARAGADLVLGSRYVEGGSIEDWGFMRRAVSRAGCWYARRVLAVGVRDLTGGFKCFRRQVLERIDLSTVEAQGYVFQVDITYRAVRAGFRVVELPISFRDRKAGSSKMTLAIALEAVWRVPTLRMSHN